MSPIWCGRFSKKWTSDGNLAGVMRVFAELNGIAMKTFIFVLLLVTGITGAWAQSESRRLGEYNLRKGLAIQGYDPVSYFSGKAEEGSAQWATQYQGITYHFSSAAHRDEFRKNPSRYEPAYGGWCAYAMGESGEKVKVDPETYKIIDNKLYLFYNFWGNNTLTTWNKNEAALKKKADSNWMKFEP